MLPPHHNFPVSAEPLLLPCMTGQASHLQISQPHILPVQPHNFHFPDPGLPAYNSSYFLHCSLSTQTGCSQKQSCFSVIHAIPLPADQSTIRPSASITFTTRSTFSRQISSVPASTITRISGSVPLSRTRIRPSLPRLLATSFTTLTTF